MDILSDHLIRYLYLQGAKDCVSAPGIGRDSIKRISSIFYILTMPELSSVKNVSRPRLCHKEKFGETQS